MGQQKRSQVPRPPSERGGKAIECRILFALHDMGLYTYIHIEMRARTGTRLFWGEL